MFLSSGIRETLLIPPPEEGSVLQMSSENGHKPYLRGQMGQALAVEAIFEGKSNKDRFFVEAGIIRRHRCPTVFTFATFLRCTSKANLDYIASVSHN